MVQVVNFFTPYRCLMFILGDGNIVHLKSVLHNVLFPFKMFFFFFLPFKCKQLVKIKLDHEKDIQILLNINKFVELLLSMYCILAE